MLSSAKIKWVKSLHLKKNRRSQGLFLAEGEKIAREILESNLEVVAVFATQTWYGKNDIQNAKASTIVSLEELQRISTLTTPNEVLLVVKTHKESKPPLPENDDLFLVIDNLQDPGNMGTIVRTADWFGVSHLICSPDTADIYNPKVIQATMGSFLRVGAHYTNLQHYLLQIPPGRPIMGAVLDGKDIYRTELPKNGLLVIGNESKGISAEVLSLINVKLSIPRFNGSSGTPESLNASVASAILLSRLRM